MWSAGHYGIMARDIAPTETNMRGEAGTAFDLWLHGALSQQFGSLDTEWVPDELLRLLPGADENEAA